MQWKSSIFLFVRKFGKWESFRIDEMLLAIFPHEERCTDVDIERSYHTELRYLNGHVQQIYHIRRYAVLLLAQHQHHSLWQHGVLQWLTVRSLFRTDNCVAVHFQWVQIDAEILRLHLQIFEPFFGAHAAIRRKEEGEYVEGNWYNEMGKCRVFLSELVLNARFEVQLLHDWAINWTENVATHLNAWNSDRLTSFKLLIVQLLTEKTSHVRDIPPRFGTLVTRLATTISSLCVRCFCNCKILQN